MHSIYIDLRDLERETDMVVVGMNKRDDWDDDIEDRAYSPRTTGVRDLLLSSGKLVTLLLCRCDRRHSRVSSGWAAAPTSTITSGNDVTPGVPSAVSAAEAITAARRLRPRNTSGDVTATTESATSGGDEVHDEAQQRVACVTSMQ